MNRSLPDYVVDVNVSNYKQFRVEAFDMATAYKAVASYYNLNDAVPCWLRMPRDISGTLITRVKDTIFVPLPRALWRECAGGCSCRFCSATGRSESPAYWDTLAIAVNAPDKASHDYAWTVHYPELHGARPKRASEARIA
jgi:hypothetical protein